MSKTHHQDQAERDEHADQARAISSRDVDQIGQIANGFLQVMEGRREHGSSLVARSSLRNEAFTQLPLGVTPTLSPPAVRAKDTLTGCFSVLTRIYAGLPGSIRELSGDKRRQ
jgi:hypothetical protein